MKAECSQTSFPRQVLQKLSILQFYVTDTNAFSFFLSLFLPSLFSSVFFSFFLLESSNTELVLVCGLITPSPLWVGVSQESHFEHFSEGEAAMLSVGAGGAGEISADNAERY